MHDLSSANNASLHDNGKDVSMLGVDDPILPDVAPPCQRLKIASSSLVFFLEELSASREDNLVPMLDATVNSTGLRHRTFCHPKYTDSQLKARAVYQWNRFSKEQQTALKIKFTHMAALARNWDKEQK